MKLLILAGGEGSRLRPVVPDVPKPLAPIRGQPFLAWQLMNWRAQGVADFLFLLRYKADAIVEFLEPFWAEHMSGLTMDWVVEPSKLGTGGAIAHAVRDKKVKGDFMTVNADTWLEGGVESLRDSKTPSLAVLRADNTSRFGKVEVDPNGRVLSFLEKRASSGPGLINAGLAKLSATLFSDWNGEALSLENHYFPNWVQQGILSSVEISGGFTDIGVPADYEGFNASFRDGNRS